MDNLYKGRCLCGQIRFEVAAFKGQVANCHCSMCRRFHGAAFATLVAVDQLNWLSGEEKLQHYQAENGTVRSFCPDCGSSIGFRMANEPLDKIELAIATFDNPIPVAVDAHIYTDNKACWHQISDGLPQHSQGRNSKVNAS